MKIYVTGFRPKPEYEEAVKSEKPFPTEGNYDIFYNVEPHWTFPWKEAAESEMRILQQMRVRVGNHYCQLEVEQVGEEKFAVVCNDHPEPQRSTECAS
jgi:hypothetical protein